MKYNIVRYCFNDEHRDHRKVIARGLTLEQAREHCKDPATRGEDAERGKWFDGYESVDLLAEALVDPCCACGKEAYVVVDNKPYCHADTPEEA